MEKIEKKIEAFSIGDGFVLDVEQTVDRFGEIVQAWIFHETYGVKKFIYGEYIRSTMTEKKAWDMVMEIVKENLEDTIADYKHNYMCEFLEEDE